VRITVAALAVPLAAGLLMPASASADPAAPAAPINANECNDAFCTPGITPGVELGAPCGDTGYYVFGVDTRNNWGRLLFCGSPRRYEPRYFRSPPMVGVKEFNSNCSGYETYVAQAPDGMFLSCAPQNNESIWVRGDA
jgi:hypothetical protein